MRRKGFDFSYVAYDLTERWNIDRLLVIDRSHIRSTRTRVAQDVVLLEPGFSAVDGEAQPGVRE